jgi:tetratricopeptide (TPR) repeat protein
VRLAELADAHTYYGRALPIYETIGDRVGLLNIFRQYVLLEQQANNTEQTISLYERCLTLADSIPAYANHPVVQGWKREYAQLRGGRDSQPSEEEQAAETMRQLAQLYTEQGAEAVREILAGQLPDKVIEQVIISSEQNMGE